MRNEVDRVVKNFPKKQSPSPDGFIAEFHKTFKVYHQCSSMHSKKKKLLREGILPKSFCKAKIILILKLSNDTSKKETIGQYH
jgi:hypothetical protein